MVRTALAVATLTLFSAGVAFAAPQVSENAPYLVAADDSTSENQALDIEQNKVPSPEAAAPAMRPQTPAGTDQELKELNNEKTDNN